MSTRTGRWWALLILLAGIGLGALHDFVFINLRFQEDFLRRGLPVSYAHSVFQGWVGGMDLGGLAVLRWTLALAFVAVMLLMAIATARLLFGGHRYRAAIVAGYAIIGTLALALHLASGALPLLRPVAVKLLHALQFPVVLVFIWAAAWIARRPAGGTDG